jgi:hypothetical protein
VERKYDIFEVLRNGNAVWLMSIDGHEDAIRRAKELAAHSTRELRVMHLPTKALIAVVTPKSDSSDLERPV